MLGDTSLVEVTARKGRCTACPGPDVAALRDGVQGETALPSLSQDFNSCKLFHCFTLLEHATLFRFKFTCLEINLIRNPNMKTEDNNNTLL